MMIWKTEWATLKGREPSGKDYIFPQLHKKGVPLRVVQKLSGHRSLDTLQRYLEVSDQDKRDAIKHLV